MNIHPLLCFRADSRAISLGNSLLTMSINAYFWHVSESKMAIIQNDDWNVLRFPLKVYKDIWFEVFDGKKCTFMCSKNFFFHNKCVALKKKSWDHFYMLPCCSIELIFLTSWCEASWDDTFKLWINISLIESRKTVNSKLNVNGWARLIRFDDVDDAWRWRFSFLFHPIFTS